MRSKFSFERRSTPCVQLSGFVRLKYERRLIGANALYL
nr:MAG TPA: hypothetical protein [Caudoviricetes sp.]